METGILAAIMATLTMIETFLPAIGSAAGGATAIVSAVTTLEKWVPLIVSLFPSATNLLQAVKNSIAALSANPATPAAQLATLQQLDAQVDTAFEAIAVQEDPDAPVPPVASI